MGFYDLTKEERKKLVERIREEVEQGVKQRDLNCIRKYASNNDTYIRKNAYLALSRLYSNCKNLRCDILDVLRQLFEDENELVRQTVVYTLGEIGK